MEKKYNGSADIYVTERCNEKCFFCSAQKGSSDVQLDYFKIYIDNWIKYGTKHVNITGGDPLLYPQLENLVKYSTEAGMNTALFTSGTHFYKEKLGKIFPNLSWLAVSIDGDSYGDRCVGRSEEHYNNAINTILYCRQNFPNVKIRIASVVTKLNIDSFDKFGKEIISKGIIPDLWRIKQIIPVRKANESWEDLYINDYIFDDLIQNLHNNFGDKIPIKANPWQSKSGDLIVTYPSGESGVTIIPDDNKNGYVADLGNIFQDFESVLHNWEKTVHYQTNTADIYMDEAWNEG